jgi:hypothetical protein
MTLSDAEVLHQTFDWFDEVARDGKTAQAHMMLRKGQALSISAGGPGIHSWPASPPYEGYEVILDHDPPRFWTRYTDAGGVVYANVPKLLITHHVVRHGGLRWIEHETCIRTPLKFDLGK